MVHAVRLGGLLLLIDFVCRHHAVGGFPVPADLADGFISKLGKTKSRRTMREPLAVLCRVGILRRVRAAVNGWHLRTSALYTLGREYAKRRVTREVDLPLYSGESVNWLSNVAREGATGVIHFGPDYWRTWRSLVSITSRGG